MLDPSIKTQCKQALTTKYVFVLIDEPVCDCAAQHLLALLILGHGLKILAEIGTKKFLK